MRRGPILAAVVLILGCGVVGRALAGDAPPAAPPAPAAPAPTAALPRQTIDLGKGVTFEMVLIPAGEFDMGSPTSEAGRESEADQPNSEIGPWTDPERLHRVRLTKPFWLAVTELSQASWEAVMGSNPATEAKGPSLPMAEIAWEDCHRFVTRLNEKVPGAGFRLPSEAEWEYACRAGSTTRFSFGDDEAMLPEYAWCVANSGGAAHPVGLLKPNAWGLRDMHGNVNEWVEDGYAMYEVVANGAVIDPTGPKAPVHPVYRGGSWHFAPHNLRSAGRGWIMPWPRSPELGVRVARNVLTDLRAPRKAGAPILGPSPAARPNEPAAPPPRALSDTEMEAREAAAARVLIEIHKSLIEQWKNSLTDEQLGQHLLGFVRGYAGTIKVRELLESPHEPYPRMRALMETAKEAGTGTVPRK